MMKLLKKYSKLLKRYSQIIDEIYKYFKKTGKWPKKEIIHLKFGKKILKQMLDIRPRLIFIKSNEEYELSQVSFWFCIQADHESKNLLISYLCFLWQKFEENPTLKEITSEEIKSILNLKEKNLNWLKEIICTLGLYSEGLFSKEGWKVSFPSDIEDLIAIKDPEKYMEKRIMEEVQKEVQIEREKLLKKIEKSIKTLAKVIIALGAIVVAFKSLLEFINVLKTLWMK